MRRAWIVGLVLVAAALSMPVFTSAPAAAQAPSIAIVSPSVATVSALGFRMEVTVADFILDQANYAGVNIPGNGHIHYTVDGALAAATWLTVFHFGSMTPGPHTVRAELRNNDHSALSPAVFQEIAVTATTPFISIVVPAASAVSALGFRMEVATGGFFLDQANYAGTNFPGHGHIHYYVDGTTLAAATTATAFNFGSLTAGAHTIRAELRNNNPSALISAVFQEIAVTATTPAIAILSPEVASVSILGVRIEVSVAGFEIDEANYGGATVAGRGHIHYSVDGTLAAATTATAFDLGALTAGTHTIRAELRNNDHSALNPAIFQEITVTAGSPEIRIMEPLGAAEVSTLGFRIRVGISNFTVDRENYAGTTVAGRGHVHFSVDGNLAAAVTSTEFNFGSLAAGTHTVRAELRNNDHSALTPAIFQEITVTAAVPSIQVSLAEATIVVGRVIVVSWTVGGFALDPFAVGGTNEAGRGHVHVFVDGNYYVATAATSVTISGLTVGSHAIRVTLHNNDHSAFSPAVSNEATLQVNPVPPAPAPVVEATLFFASLGILLVVIVVLLVALLIRMRKPHSEGPMEKKNE